MKAIILYDSRSEGGSTDRLVDAIGQKLAEKGADVEKARCRAQGDYSFISEFDLVIMGAPVYYLMVSSQLLGALIQSDLSNRLKTKHSVISRLRKPATDGRNTIHAADENKSDWQSHSCRESVCTCRDLRHGGHWRIC